MAKTTGVILAIGAITVANRVVFNGKDMDWRIPVATGLASMTFAALEKVNQEAALSLSYMALISVLLTRIDPKVPSPTESALDWWNTPAGGTKKKSSAPLNTSTGSGVYAA
ncbi:hypothetical protein SAMN05216489_09987 [Streptomyces sp. 3213]|uniref:hypothetical protein n=1 Tax=Streptomyces sp. 3213.3 TaxID=1855348 RepID=UPI0008967F75|nr:hypothetical protein [Streptomyces sp. 3213.3]SEF12909.1 hypothetical protein SAMN05216489_09987 [Streptomyces sp. 3213] [Streptomyces sp. 3213.3]